MVYKVYLRFAIVWEFDISNKCDFAWENLALTDLQKMCLKGNYR